MKKRILIITMAVGLSVLFVSAGLYAGTAVKDEIRMENKAYAKHDKPIHVFTHKQHATIFAEKYPDLFPNGCGECHHAVKDGKAVPLKNLKEGDDVKNCIECHKKPGHIKSRDAKKQGLDHKQQLQYHANALHENCQECHKKYNKKMGLKSRDDGYAPTKSKCKVCHAK